MASEAEIIKRLRELFPKIGDDAAILRSKNEMIVSTDSFVAGEHFGDYFTPYDIGYKSLAASLSDIAACGGVPKYALISIGLKTGDIGLVEEFYKGVHAVASAYNVEIMGGDTTKSATMFVNVAVIGETERFISRSGAHPGDVVCVTGELGASHSGLIALKRGIKSSSIARHLHPHPRIKEGVLLSKYVSAMIDISDGLIIDLFHILDESKVCAKLWRNKLPISKDTTRIAREVSISEENIAMYGGEDFELLFTIPRNKLKTLNKQIEFTEIGEITKCEMRDACITDEEGNEIPIKGFDHFNR